MKHLIKSSGYIGAALVLVSVVLVQVVQVTATEATSINRINVGPAGEQANNWTEDPDISGDGRYVVFESGATNLVAGDTNGVYDIFIRDLQTNSTTRASVDSAGAQANGSSNNAAISNNGRYVAFVSSATNLVPGDTNGVHDAFVYDRQTGDTVVVSVSNSGVIGGAMVSYPKVSNSGEVMFVSTASNLVPGDTNGVADVFIRDTQASETIRVSVSSSGVQADAISYGGGISADGQYVLIDSEATNLVAGDTNGTEDIFLHDRQTGDTTRLSVSSAGVQGNDYSYSPQISKNGRYVVFGSNATNLVANDTNGRADVFVHDVQTATTERVNVTTAGNEANHTSYYFDISGDGQYVTFDSRATNLASDDTNDSADIFVHDRQTGETTMVSYSDAGTMGDNWSLFPSISDDGGRVVFQSEAANLLTESDTNNQQDIFLVNFSLDDSDNIPTVIEDAAPNNGDGNNDGVQDSRQPHVVSFENSVTSSYVTVELDDVCVFTSASSQNEAALDVQDSGYEYKAGLVNFIADCGTPGYTTSTTLFVHDTSKGTQVLRKHNPTNNAFFTVDDAILTNETIGGKTVVVASYSITDGGILDSDNTENGTIVDPIGLATSSVGVPNTGF